MLNQIVLVGRLTSAPTIKEEENGRKVGRITLAIPRSYKNADGIYETDFVNITLWTAIAENTAEYCKKGDIVGVKGRIETTIIDNGDGSREYRPNIIAERVSFLSSKKADSKEGEN